MADLAPESYPAARQLAVAVQIAVHDGDYEAAALLVRHASQEELAAAVIMGAELADAAWRMAAESPDALREAYQAFAFRLAVE